MSSSLAREPFRPIAAVVVLFVTIFGLAVAADVISIVTWEEPAPGHVTVGPYDCVDVQGPNPLTITTPGPPKAAPPTINAHAAALIGAAKVCLQRPTIGQRAALAVHAIGDHLIAFTLLLLILLCVRSGRRDGLFTPGLVRRVQRLGWVALAAAVLWPFIDAACVGFVMQGALVDATWTDALRHPDPSWYALVTALGIITIARVLRQAVSLQQEVDETV